MNTKNFNEITMTGPTTEDYHNYDVAVGEILGKLIEVSKSDNIVRLYGFNRKNKSHLFVLRIALMARNLAGCEVEVDCRLRDLWHINRKIKRNFGKVRKYKISSNWPYEKGIYVNNIIKHSQYSAFSLADVYEVYYEGSCN